MSYRHEGNGETNTQIDLMESPGHVLICPHDLKRLPHNIAVIINTAFNDWLKKHPGIRIRTTLPFTQDGQTTAIHVWFDRPDVDVG